MKIEATEAEIQKAIIEELEWNKDVYCIRSNSFAGKIIRPNGSTGWIKNNKKGKPDIVICYKGLWIGLEIKPEKGKQSKDQKQAEEDIKRAGGQYYIIRNKKDLDKVLNSVV